MTTTRSGRPRPRRQPLVDGTRKAIGARVPPARLLRELRKALQAKGSVARGAGMQAYMRSSMPCQGVSTPVGRAICRELYEGLAFRDAADWAATTRYLWRNSKFREERYAVITLARSKAARPFQGTGALPVYEELISTGAWWDYVDEIAIQCVGPILRAHRSVTERRLGAWSRSGDLWLRRASIICQVGSKDETDPELLAGCIEPSMGSREFFLRKGIGWALRAYAATNPEWVRGFVRRHEAELSPLSRREALRHLS